MKRGERVSETHIMVLRYPSQGHINPMLQFSRRLASKGPRVTLVIPTASIYNAQANSINIEIICEGLEKRKEEERTEDYVERFRMVASQSLAELIEKHSHSAKILVYDSFMPWAQDVATRLGLDGAAFFTQSCAVSVIYYLVNQGALNMPLEGEVASMPWMPVLCINDLPSIIDGKSSDTAALSFLLNQFSNFQKVKWILFNTYDKLEDEVINWMASQRPIKAIGPTVPSMYLDKMLEDDRDYGLSLFKQNADCCITWLDTKGSGSVVYVSFGSMASQGKEQMEELAWGLRKSNTHFIWCPQLEVLAHKAVGCFLTHCGWNSTLEALSLGVPMIAMPQFLDQTTNARFGGGPKGHISPMFQFCKRLVSKGLKVTLVTTTISIIQSIHAQASSSITIELLSNELGQQKDESLEAYLQRFSIVDLGEHLGLDGVPFFTQSCAVSAIYYHFYQGVFNTPLEESTVSMPSMPLLRVDDLPSFVMKWMASQRPLIKTIGPTVPSMYLDKRLEDDKDYGLSLFQQNVDTCITWLDTKGIGSVVYVSFGSLASLGEEQMEELAWGLKRSNSHFIWCGQLEVLAHKAVGCFMTHCGWNSTLEALSLGVPMIAMPWFSDQTTNAKFRCALRKSWRRERNEMKRNAERWKELAKEAVNEGGSSDKNIEEFVAEILCT
ncbi:hypothetical protein AAG906_022727 [Vitis piasezkii]